MGRRTTAGDKALRQTRNGSRSEVGCDLYSKRAKTPVSGCLVVAGLGGRGNPYSGIVQAA